MMLRGFKIVLLAASVQIFWGSSLFAQMPYILPDPNPPDIVQTTYFEIWGNSGGYTVNYDAMINYSAGVRAGLFAYPDRDFDTFASSGFVLMGNFFYGNEVHKLELGGGGFFDFRPDRRGTELMATTTTGYRIDPRDKDLVFRIGFTPAFNGKEFRVQFGLSIGYRLDWNDES